MDAPEAIRDEHLERAALNGNAGLGRAREMPDIAVRGVRDLAAELDWVGMSNIRQPLRIRDGDAVREVEAQAQIYVDLGDARARGIHMSRLYLILDEHADAAPLSVPGLKLLLASMLESHRGLSARAFVQFDFDCYLRRKALLSDHSGWNAYPASIKGACVNGEMQLELTLGVFYSSTCPCSAALARQLVQQQFEHRFGAAGTARVEDVKAWLGTEDGMAGTPHSQRSIARLLVKLRHTLQAFPITALVDRVESALQTPVQTAVKREDEQEFARLNAANLMFCEDAGRRVKAALDVDDGLVDFRVRVEHHESLHAHDAVAVFTKGIKAGYQPLP